jgi:hypothetical protein
MLSASREKWPMSGETRLADLHSQLLGGSAAALDTLAGLLLQPMVRALRAGFPRACNDLLATAAEDAILEYGRCPHRFDPSRAVPIDRYLLFAARRNLLNLLEAEERRLLREGEYAKQEAQTHRSICWFPLTSLDRNRFRQQILAIGTDRVERRAIVLWLNGGSATEDLAAALRLSHLPMRERRKEVKRFKDRIVARFRRHISRARNALEGQHHIEIRDG